MVSNESGEAANVEAGSLFGVVDGAFELERLEGAMTIEVAKFGDNLRAGMHDPKMVGKVTEVEGTARVEKTVETDVGRQGKCDGRKAHVNGDGHRRPRRGDGRTETGDGADQLPGERLVGSGIGNGGSWCSGRGGSWWSGSWGSGWSWVSLCRLRWEWNGETRWVRW